MSKTNVFIYGSCVSRDTFDHFDPQHFALTQYVARQSALSAYTRPVELLSPPPQSSRFQQRMVAGDFESSLQRLIPEAGPATDLVLVDLIDERLGVYILPDGSVVTRSMELISSFTEDQLPEGSQFLPFGSDRHFQYWTSAIEAVGDMFRVAMPRAAIVLLDIPWAERSESGGAAPDSFGVTAQQANPTFKAYLQVATRALGAQVVSVEPNLVTSSPSHPWGEAPFHYSESVYLDIVQQVTGAPGRAVWQTTSPADRTATYTGGVSVSDRLGQHDTSDRSLETLAGGPNFLVAGVPNAGADWLAKQLAQHPDVYVAKGKGRSYFNRPGRTRSQEETALYLKAMNARPGTRWRGDCTPDYFWAAPGGPFGPRRPSAAPKIKELVDDGAPIFVVLRNPVARAVQAYWERFVYGDVDLQAGIFRAPKQFGIIDQSFYARALRQWSSTLGRDRLHVVLHDDLVADARTELTRALHALGLAPSDEYWRVTDLKAETEHKPWVRKFKKRHPLDPQEIAALLELFRRDIVAVEKFLQRDLPEWRDRESLVANLTDISK